MVYGGSVVESFQVQINIRYSDRYPASSMEDTEESKQENEDIDKHVEVVTQEETPPSHTCSEMNNFLIGNDCNRSPVNRHFVHFCRIKRIGRSR